MPAARSFTELQFWKQARVWSKEIFQFTQRKPFADDRKLVIQVNDSSESIMANIAEGFGRGTQGEFVLFLGYALGSLDETQSHLCAAYDRDFLNESEFARLFREGTEIRKLTVAFIRSMVLFRGGVKTRGSRPNWSDQNWEMYECVTGMPRPAMFRQNGDAERPVRNDAPPV